MTERVVVIKTGTVGDRGNTGTEGLQGISGIQGDQGETATEIQVKQAIGTPDVIIVTYDNPPLVLTDKVIVGFIPTNPNLTQTPTFNPNGLTPAIITKFGGQLLVPGDISGNGSFKLVQYTEITHTWELLNPSQSDIGEIDGGDVGGIPQSGQPIIINLNFPGLVSNITSNAIYTFTQDVKFPINSFSMGATSGIAIAFLGSSATVTFTELNKILELAFSNTRENLLSNEPLDNWGSYSNTILDGVGVQIQVSADDLNNYSVLFKWAPESGAAPAGQPWLGPRYTQDIDNNKFFTFFQGESLYISPFTIWGSPTFANDLQITLQGIVV